MVSESWGGNVYKVGPFGMIWAMIKASKTRCQCNVFAREKCIICKQRLKKKDIIYAKKPFHFAPKRSVIDKFCYEKLQLQHTAVAERKTIERHT